MPIATLYPGISDREAQTRLRQALYRLHRVFPESEQFIEPSSHTLRWNLDAPCTLDVLEFRQAMKQHTVG